MLLKEKLFIGGQWIAPAGRETIDVHNAGNGEVTSTQPGRPVKSRTVEVPSSSFGACSCSFVRSASQAAFDSKGP